MNRPAPRPALSAMTTLTALTLLSTVTLTGCDAKLDATAIEKDIQTRLYEEHSLTVTADCPKDRKRPREGIERFTCRVTLADDTSLDAIVEVNADGEAHWRIDLNSRSYIEQTLTFAIATRRAAPDTPLSPKALSCPDAPNLAVDTPIRCAVTWPNDQQDEITLDLLSGQDLPSWRAPASLRMYDSPAALSEHLLSIARTARPHLQSLDCDDADTLLLALPLPCAATLTDPAAPIQTLTATLQPDGVITITP